MHHNARVKNVHGRVGVKRPARLLSEGQQRKRVRRAQTNPWHQTAAPRVRKVRRGNGRWMIIPKGYPSSPSKTKSPTVLDVQEHVEVESFLHTKEAAEYIDMSVGYVKDHAQALGGEKHGLRWRFSYEALDRWKAEKK